MNCPEEQMQVDPLKDIPVGQLKQLELEVIQVAQLLLQAEHDDPFK
jgi:hypothetical protein